MSSQTSGPEQNNLIDLDTFREKKAKEAAEKNASTATETKTSGQEAVLQDMIKRLQFVAEKLECIDIKMTRLLAIYENYYKSKEEERSTLH